MDSKQGVGLRSCPPLSDDNYAVWSQKMEAVLVRQQLFHVIEDPIPLQPDRVWRDQNRQAKALITLSVSDDQLIHIRDLATAQEMWQALRDVHLKEGSAFLLFQRLFNLKLKAGDCLQKHLTQLKYLRGQLMQRNLNFSEPVFCLLIILSLDGRYATVVSQLVALPVADLTVTRICSMLLSEADRQAAFGASEGENGASKAPPPVAQREEGAVALKATRCYKCGAIGHLQRNCRKGQKPKEATRSSGMGGAGGRERAKPRPTQALAFGYTTMPM